MHRKGRLKLSSDIDTWFRKALIPAGLEILSITPEITLRATDLSPVHKDPFDRLIVTTALAYNAKLATIDSVIVKYPELENVLMTQKN